VVAKGWKRHQWACRVSGLGIAVIAIEILSRIRFVLEVKTAHFLMILCMVVAAAGGPSLQAGKAHCNKAEMT